MKLLLSLFICLGAFMSISQEGAIWTTPTSGTIDGVPFTVTNVSGASTQNYDFSTADFSAAPLSSSQPSLDYEGYSTVTITLETPIYLYVYAKYWRTDTYSFSDPVSYLSGSNLTLVNSTTADAVSYADGIFQVLSPVSTFTITSTQSCCSSQAMTFGGLCIPTQSSINLTVCKSYTVPSGDETYTSSGIYKDTIPNAANCDSIITIDLTVDTVNIDVINDSPTLESEALNASFQWIDCDNGNQPISGETSAVFVAQSNGNYAVIVTQNGCTDTSSCEIVNNIGLSGQQLNQEINVSPNPSNGKFFVKSGVLIDKVTVMDNSGRIVKTLQIDGLEGVVELTDFSKGVYILKVRTQQGVITKQVIRQ